MSWSKKRKEKMYFIWSFIKIPLEPLAIVLGDFIEHRFLGYLEERNRCIFRAYSLLPLSSKWGRGYNLNQGLQHLNGSKSLNLIICWEIWIRWNIHSYLHGSPLAVAIIHWEQDQINFDGYFIWNVGPLGIVVSFVIIVCDPSMLYQGQLAFVTPAKLRSLAKNFGLKIPKDLLLANVVIEGGSSKVVILKWVKHIPKIQEHYFTLLRISEHWLFLVLLCS